MELPSPLPSLLLRPVSLQLHGALRWLHCAFLVGLSLSLWDGWASLDMQALVLERISLWCQKQITDFSLLCGNQEQPHQEVDPISRSVSLPRGCSGTGMYREIFLFVHGWICFLEYVKAISSSFNGSGLSSWDRRCHFKMLMWTLTVCWDLRHR